ncbi:hypothetical protein [Enterococcus avium]|uniref:hypothetical protein n=1 Tax=Enterococcus avium TaxID=33945 RepID=UPI001F59E236|nr:hypothetical protein [Enterococcus avium]
MNSKRYISNRNIRRLKFLFLSIIAIFFIVACEQKTELKRTLTSDSGWWSYFYQEEKGTIEFCDNYKVVVTNKQISRGGEYEINQSETELKLIMDEGDIEIIISDISIENKKTLIGYLKLKGKSELFPIKLEKQ